MRAPQTTVQRISLEITVQTPSAPRDRIAPMVSEFPSVRELRVRAARAPVLSPHATAGGAIMAWDSRTPFAQNYSFRAHNGN